MSLPKPIKSQYIISLDDTHVINQQNIRYQKALNKWWESLTNEERLANFEDRPWSCIRLKKSDIKLEPINFRKAYAIIHSSKKPAEYPLEEMLDLLPRQTYNCEPFGLMLMQTGGNKSKAWTCAYYTHFSKKSDDRIPVIKGSSNKVAVYKMLQWFMKNMPKSFK